MPSVTLEALLLLATMVPLILLGFSYVWKQPTCAISFNPLTQINNAIQAAYTQPYSRISVPINATLTITANNNTVSYTGCNAPYPAISDPNKIIKSYGANRVVYSLNISETTAPTPCNLVVEYYPLNRTLQVGCA
ncbi:hypothetical protein B9Q04_00305 [Candidatus Marsarchaeota G2 archaeon BE_D]|jgi:hypothetical protein|uniref:Uncharacterized protein n=4 Tax=Candidatus Marsarchaeota group 2 TaxID=2203771 RepID=A0A2R6CEW8_9ARCH|nr:MAG: hypothetical protein B9Q06_00685 [Candidatus Marsarchaeota G2 archaeon ECH_B_2]PSO01263.1 MAG: hypothetical protein B9Q07_00090 [Candidatus Marsarchaeota G2 archaeon ECH_B_3]PSO03397.1 MAG: hypothetical protein B9Q05_00685 [Candidatus Marsarchaeota G2 archaeon ECH_B_1]PSO09465.1 MAG: hypothetical protein B9Q04_00305 [Candidatus Marsarchaeota G2 archaeon BE_D]